MATTTMATVDSILKEVYETGVNDQLQSEVIGLKRIERTSEGVTHTVGGKYVRFPIRTRRNHGIGARNETEALPVPQSQSYKDAQVKLKYNYGSLELTGQAFELADKDFQAFASVLDQEVNGLKEGLRKDSARQVYGDGSGVMATATSAGTTTTFITTNAQYLEEGMIVDIFASDKTTVRVSNATINSITQSGANYTVTVGTAMALASAVGDVITRKSSLNKEWTGLGAIVGNTGTLYNIDSSVTSVWKSIVDSNGGTNRALSEGLMTTMVDNIRIKGGGMPTVVLCGLGVRRAYANLLTQLRRTVNTQEFTGGFKGLAFVTDTGDLPIVSDLDCPPNTMYFLNEKEIKLYQAGDWSFMNRDGSNWVRKTDASGTYDAYDATMYQYAEVGTHRRNAHGKIVDITEG